ncbi:MAG: hypothetical protein AAB373_05645 [Patescibacteria group bacterium]
MFNHLSQFAVINKLLNVKNSEWPKVSFVWFFKLLYRISFVICWTVLLSMFVSHYGITFLPLLFILNAVFTIIGSFVYSTLLNNFDLKKKIVGTIFIAGFVFFVSIFCYFESSILFFAFLILNVAIFLSQLKILLNAYFEEFFSPVEGERILPLLESSDTLGGIIAGAAILTLASSFEVYNFLYLAIGAIFLLVPLLLFCADRFIPANEEHIEPGQNLSYREKFLSLFKKDHFRVYFIGLVLIVFCQWFLFNLLEFQYTNAVYESVSNTVLDAGSGFEHAFIHDLGLLFILFSSSALLIQIFVASRLISYLGVVNGLLLHPVVTLLSLFGMAIYPGFLTTVLAKNNFTITQVVYNNAYHMSYYSLRDESREFIREFLEGVVRPIGAILGTLCLVLLQKVFAGNLITFSINCLMILVCLVLLYVSYLQSSKYTKMALKELNDTDDYQIKSRVLEVLQQGGHDSNIENLGAFILNKNNILSFRIKALKALFKNSYVSAVNTVIEVLKNSDFFIKESILDLLIVNSSRLIKDKDLTFLKYKLIVVLQEIYEKEKDEVALKKIIYLISKLSGLATLNFVFKILNAKNHPYKSDVILALKNFNDPEVTNILKGYFYKGNAAEQMSAAICLFKNRQYKQEALIRIYSFLYSKNTQKITSALFAIGELGLKANKEICFKLLQSNNSLVKVRAAIALAKLGEMKSLPVIFDLLLTCDDESFKVLRGLIPTIHGKIAVVFDKILKKFVTDLLNGLQENKFRDIISLERLKYLSKFADDFDRFEKLLSIK